ncbi:MAG TPA: tetratricopeptide repeat protein [Thermoanaerobaculia bacterium]|nr:tetratricopeptide repeat protein [Thermoanaerobaculia bacterium]
MTSEGAIAFATFAVTSLGIVAASIQPTKSRAQSILTALVVVFVVGTGAWVCVKIFAPESLRSVHASGGTTSTEETTTVAPTGTGPTRTFEAPIEPGEITSTVSTTTTTGVLTPRRMSPQPKSITATTETADPRRVISRPEWEIPSQFSGAAASSKESAPQHEPAKLTQDKWTLKLNALSCMERDDWPNAIAAWSTWIRSYAGADEKADHVALSQLGIAYEKQQDWSHAIDTLERANARSTGDADALIHLGRCYERVQRWPDALRVYENALRIEPRNALASHGRSVAQTHVGR